jgi:DNA repair protein RadD
MKLRPYQEEAVTAVYEHLRTRQDNPCIVLPTGTGKSLVLAQIATDTVKLWNGRVLLLAHVKELLEQNADKIRKLCPDVKIGIYSAGLKSRDTQEDIIVGGIQSVYNKACELGKFDLVLIDEAHLIPPDGEGMYRKLLGDLQVINPDIRIVGLTATPYRLNGGVICKPQNILNKICYETSLKEMIEQGYLSKLTTKAGRAEAQLSNLHIRAGEFIAQEVDEAMNQETLVNAACREIVALTQDRKAVLIFAASVPHCKAVAKKITEVTQQECAIVTGDTPAQERAEILRRIKGEAVIANLWGETKPPLKYVVNVNVLTTGFDAPNIDCVVLLRPTASPGLLVQMVGRGTRLATGKENCLVLDFGENIMRHGPLDIITVKEENKKKKKDSEAPAKKCPKCQALLQISLRYCPDCGYEFPESTVKHSTTASTAAILSGEVQYSEYPVQKVYYSVHTKRGEKNAPKTMRIDYMVSLTEKKSEWVCPEHSGWVRQKFEKWWRDRAALGCEVPRTAEEAVDLASNNLLRPVHGITVKAIGGEKFDRIVQYQFGDRPQMREPGDEDLPIIEYHSNSPGDLGVHHDDCIPF